MVERDLHRLANEAPFVVFECKQIEGGRFFFPCCSQSIKSLLSVDPEKLEKDGHAAWAHLDSGHVAQVQDAFLHSFQTLAPVEVQFRVQTPRKELLWVRCRAYPQKVDGAVVWNGFMEDVTESVLREDDAKRRNSLLRNIFENLPDLIYYKDAEGRLVDANAICCRHHNAALESIQGKTDRDLYPGVRGENAWQREQELMADGTVLRQSECFEKEDGTVLHLDTVKIPLFSKSGRLLGLAGISRDVTTHILGEQELVRAKRESEQYAAFIQTIFDNLDDQFYYKDAQSRVLGGNKAWVKHCGAESLDELIGKTDLELYPGDLGRELFAGEQALLAAGENVRRRERHELEDRSVQYFESIKCPMRNETGEVVGLAGISRDITTQVMNETALLQAKRESEQYAAFIQTIFDNLDDQFYYKDAQSRVLGGNKAWVTHCGAESLDELIGKTDLELYPGDLGKELFSGEQALLAAGENVRRRERHEREDGSIQYYESIKCPMRNEKGEVVGLAGISRDITKQVESENELVEARKAAEAANEAKSMFLAMMSHEIRTPMNGVVGAASLLSDTDLTPLQREFVKTINVSGENLLAIINDILDYSKIEAGKILLENVPFSLRSCVEDSFDLFARSASRKNLELFHYIDPDIPEHLMGDPSRLRQVIINLVGNAVKFTEKGEVGLRVVAINDDSDGEHCRIRAAVKDTGIGIQEEAQKNLFQAFVQVEGSSTRKYEGTGLGLTISRRMIELMGGRIWLESKYGEGTTFYFELDLPIASESPDYQHHPIRPSALIGKRALVVDDNETNRWLLSDQLTQWSMESSPFAFPKEALASLSKDDAYDIALLDFNMPEMDGMELARAIQKHYGEQRIPVVILSSTYEDFGSDPAIDAWLSKPVKQDYLRKQLVKVFSSDVPEKVSVDSSTKRVQVRKEYDLRILVAEDNGVNRRVVKMMLERLGYTNVVIVPDGQDAVAAFIDFEFDVVLMDVQMPGMDGLEASRQIRLQTGCAEQPWIIALTAGVMEEERAAVFKAGMNDFLPKPLKVEVLGQVLEQVRCAIQGNKNRETARFPA
ncbi:MAG: PAS domain-containing protein [Pontiellaceae bacterium]|nr:PAS domain-containing protein [Pontiellaceae bacterium]